MAAGTNYEDIQLQNIPLKCTVTQPHSDVNDDIDTLPSEVAPALPAQSTR